MATTAASDAQGDPAPIMALMPQGTRGQQFVCYADACSGVPGAPHERTFASINAVIARLRPQPEFIVFPGDEIIGLTADSATLAAQWRHWHDNEMAWLDRTAIPIYHATGNHTTYDARSEAVFRAALPHLPRNGPPGQEGLSYYVRRGELLLIVVNTCWSGFGIEGQVELTWLEQTLREHADTTYRLVAGHHPVFAVNGFAGDNQRDVASAQGAAFWRILVEHRVLAYLCSHILAFDVQVHEGVLQIVTAGAGTAHRMPPESEYLHAMQCALDADQFRYQVLDAHGQRREWLSWPVPLPPETAWQTCADGAAMPGPDGCWHADGESASLVVWQIAGRCAAAGDGTAQTLLSGWQDVTTLAHLWIGLVSVEPYLAVLICPSPGRSPHLWRGPALKPGETFSLELAFHAGMGPGGVMWRWDAASPWSSLTAASPWGTERLIWPEWWSVGHGQHGAADRAYRGDHLTVRSYATTLLLEPPVAAEP